MCATVSYLYIGYTCVLFSYSQGRRRAGAFLPLFSQKGSNGVGANFSSQYRREIHG